jgi:RNA polymerase sigma-70 factor (ECF subfamily)
MATRKHLVPWSASTRSRRRVRPHPPETILVAGSGRGAVLEAMQSLLEKYRVVLYHRYLIDLSEAEVAKILGIPRGTMKSRASRGLARLRVLLEAEGRDLP